MKKNMPRIISIVLCLVLVLTAMSALFACKKTEEEATVAPVKPVQDFTDVGAVATVNGEEIPPEEFNYWLGVNKDELEYYNGVTAEESEEFWKTGEIEGVPAAEHLRSKTMQDVTKQVVLRQKAREAGIEVTDEDRAQIVNQLAQAKVQAESEAAFNNQLASMRLTEDSFKLLSEYGLLANRYYSSVSEEYTEDEIKDYYNKSMIRVKHILIKTTEDADDHDDHTGHSHDLEGDALAEAEERANAALARVAAGEDFDALMEELSEDPGSQIYPQGYTMSKYSNMVPEFLEASFALANGEHTGLVKSSFGYHIIKRYAVLEEDYEENAADIPGFMLQEALEKWTQEAEVVVNEENMAKVEI